MSYETRYAAAMRQRTRERDNGPEAIAERHRYNAAMVRVRADVAAKYRELTPDNATDALAYQQERISFHLAQRGS